MSMEKIANNQPLTREDVVAAAYELAGMEKAANDADAQGRELAHEYFDGLVKEAQAKEAGEPSAEVTAAIEVLRKNNVIPA
jgi:hypothetical protein